MTVSLTELRQRLFQLADQVVDSGEPLYVLRRRVRLRLERDEPAPPTRGRLARLKTQQLVIGPALDPHESPAQWSETGTQRAAEPAVPAAKKPRAARSKRK